MATPPPEEQGLQVPLQGEDIAPFKVAPTGKCWWCGDVADTREHKFKRTDLTRMWPQGDHLVWGDGTQTANVRSARKSTFVKFSANLCGACNNTRSQPFDVAYDKFASYVWQHQDSLWSRRYLDMSKVYGAQWGDEATNLARYVAKHMGCRMAHENYPVPAVLKPFLDGGSKADSVHMVLYKDPALRALRQKGKRDGVDSTGLWIEPAIGGISRSRNRLTRYVSGLTIGTIGVMYVWDDDVVDTDPFYVYRRARLHRRDDLPST
jgi:hypothetical protein